MWGYEQEDPTVIQGVTCSFTLKPPNPSPFEKVYKKGNHLGDGAFGEVWQVHTIGNAMEEFAVKIFDLQKVDDEEKMELTKEIETEVMFLQNMSHETIIRFVDYFQMDTILYIVTEEVLGGELMDDMLRIGCYPESHSRLLMINLLEGLAYMESQRIVHRDIKPTNILLVGPSAPTKLKICDYGASIQLPEGTMAKGRWYTPGYAAPELLAGKSYDMAIDTFSTGVVAYMLLTGCIPWHQDVWEDDAQMNEAAMQGDIEWSSDVWEGKSDFSMDFVMRAMAVNPEHRPSAMDLLAHPWIQSVDEPNPKSSGENVTNGSSVNICCCFSKSRRQKQENQNTAAKQNESTACREVTSKRSIRRFNERRVKAADRMRRRQRKRC